MSFYESIEPFLFGGFSGMFATSIIQPIDTVKVRIQIAGEAAKGSIGPLSMGRKVIAEEGVRALYAGLDSALLRQATYTTARLGIFRSLTNEREAFHKGSIPFIEKFGISMVSGFFGSIIGNPADLTLIRFQADKTLPVDQRRNYKNVVDAFSRIVKEEGTLGLWKGCGPTVARAVSLNAGQLSTFEEIKQYVTQLRGQNDAITRIIAGAGSGVVCAVVSLPFDNIKTKLQKMKADANGVYPYKGMIDCFGKSIAREGVTGLWIGLPTYIIRIAPHSIISLFVLDWLNSNYGPASRKKK